MKSATNDKQDKSKVITFRVTPEEEQEYREQAEIAGLPLSEYIRRRLKGSKIIAKQPMTDKQTVANLRQIGGLIKQLFISNKISDLQLDNALQKIYNVIGYVNNS